MHLGPVRIDADLNRLHAEIAQPRRLRFPDHHRIGLELDAEGERAGPLQNFEKIFAQENLAAAQRQDKDSGVSHLFQQVLDFGGGHLAVVVVIEIAVHALLVAAVGEIELHAERNAQLQCPVAHLLQQRAHRLVGLLRRRLHARNRFV